ncbi:ABC-three component system protein [Marinobacter salarius]|jgi:hypothetical protein|uniref:ABC-three component system protein n=1 Tax=Marinobacter salarius TaxID=1420917 RepID=UPI0018F211F0|nr:ABC-three component system protein [Marinobacter salarius]MBJ7278885.1 hypothetical protein [Marinobacter salarius]|tara:strand:- start:7469 stop:8680 length:1212 start_codon:yes stop_codon:yes gene_type:complete
MKKAHTEKTSAADKAIGFDFQYYHFLWRLITLKSDESVGLEVLDDVHAELATKRKIFIQLKHTTQKNADGTPRSMTQLDVDMWKTFSNWCKIIADEESGRGNISEQLGFVKETDFVLSSNKTDNLKNSVLTAIRALQEGLKTYSTFKDDLSDIKSKTKDEKVEAYIDTVLALDAEVANIFFKNISFDLGCDDIVEKCKTAIKEHHIDDGKVDDVFSDIDSRLRQENFSLTKNKEKITFSFDDFRKKYRIYFDQARNGKLRILEFNGALPEKLVDQMFIQQLIDIKDIEPEDTERMAMYTRCLLYMVNNFDRWEKDGDISRSQIDDFKREAKARWQIEFDSAYRKKLNEDEILEKALDIFDAIRKEKLELDGQLLPTEMNNGCYYDLSNIPKIGWHKYWESKYK